jgi:hypothetical protein
MRRTLMVAWAAALAVPLCGCASGPMLENPAFIQTDPYITVENPVYLPGNPPAYNPIFEKAVAVVGDYFSISYANRQDGRIETYPRVSPSLVQPLKPGSPDYDQRLLATLQSIRERAVVLIRPAENGGYFVDVKIFKDLEDLPRPTAVRAGSAAFQGDVIVDRGAIVIDEAYSEPGWIPIGRDVKLEQVVLQRLRKCPMDRGE